MNLMITKMVKNQPNNNKQRPFGLTTTNTITSTTNNPKTTSILIQISNQQESHNKKETMASSPNDENFNFSLNFGKFDCISSDSEEDDDKINYPSDEEYYYDEDDEEEEKLEFNIQENNLISHNNNNNTTTNNNDKNKYLNIPFWFSNEDEDQIKSLIQIYSKKAYINEEAQKCIRAPAPFIGRVSRSQVEHDEFCTLDRVDVFYLDFVVPQWETMKFNKTLIFLTTWGRETGEPLVMNPLTQSQVTFWTNKILNINNKSYLYCLPVYSTKGEFRYHTAKVEESVGYSSVPFVFSKFIRSPRKNQIDQDKELFL